MRTSRSSSERVGRPGQVLVLLVLIVVVGALSLGHERVQSVVGALFGLVASRPQSAAVSEAPPERSDAELQVRVEAAARLLEGDLSVAVVDLERGATAGVDAERVMPAASLFKLPILVEVLAQEADGRLPPERLLEIGDDDWSEGSGVLQARVGERLAVRELRRLMIQESDNIAALVLMDAVGAANVNARMAGLGLHDTRVVNFRGGEDGEHVTSAADMARLLSMIAQDSLIDARVSSEARRLLELPQAHTWLGEGLPWWVKVAHKWGDLPDSRNDVGIVSTPSGSYVVAVLTRDAPADDAQRTISRVSVAAYEHLR